MPVRLAVHDPNARIAPGIRVEHTAHVWSRRGVVGDAQLPLGVELSPDRLDGTREPAPGGVVGGHDDREERPVGERLEAASDRDSIRGRERVEGRHPIAVAHRLAIDLVLADHPVLERLKAACPQERYEVGYRPWDATRPTHERPEGGHRQPQPHLGASHLPNREAPQPERAGPVERV